MTPTETAAELRRYSRKIGQPAGDVPSVMLAAAEEIERMRAMLMVALEVLEDVKGNINPERGYADELEDDVKRAISTILKFGPSVPDQKD